MRDKLLTIPTFSATDFKRPLLFVLALLALIMVSALLAWRAARSETPTLLAPGQTIAQEIATAVSTSEMVTAASGGYVPEQGLFLYSRLTDSNSTMVRTWATNQLRLFIDELADLPADETLIWVIDYGQSQEIIEAPLSRAAEPTTHSYLSWVNLLTNEAAEPSEAAEPAAEVASAPPLTEVPTAEPVAENQAEVTVEETAPEVAAPPVEVPAAVGNIVTQPTTIFTGDFAEGAGGWLPLAGDWVAQDGVYIQNDNSGFDLITILDVTPVSHFTLEAQLQSLDGQLGGGFIYNAPTAESRAKAQIIDLTEQGSFLRWGHYNEQGDYVFDGGAAVEPAVADGNWHTLRIVSKGAETIAFLDDQEMGVIQNQSQSGYVGLVTSQAQVQFDDVSVIQLPADGLALLPAAEFTANFDDGQALNWTPFTGVWEVVDGSYQQTEAEGFDFGTTADFQGSDYTMTANLLYLEGEMGGGFYYNMSQPNNKAGSQMVNFTQQGDVLQWGHFSDNGEFVFVDSAPIPNVADGEWHTLELVVTGGRATVLLDGEIITADMALTYTSGYVGLLASQSKVAFDDVHVVPENALALGDSTVVDKLYDFEDNNTADWLPFAGDWGALDGRYEQRQTNEWDRISALNLRMTGPYRLSTEVRFIEGTMNGGLIFNMQQRDRKAQSQMISFTGNGDFLQWGSFDDEGIFVYQSGIPVRSVLDSQWHELVVEVSDQTYNIILDGVTLVTDVPMAYQTGFVGLFGGQGWTVYDNVRVAGPAQSTVVRVATEEVPVDETVDTPAEEIAPEAGDPTAEPDGS